MADAGIDASRQNLAMRRLLVGALAIALAACAPASVAPETSTPLTDTAAAAPTAASPTAEPVATPTPVPPAPVGPTGPQVTTPKVTLVQQSIAFGTLPHASPGTAEEIQLVEQNLPFWADSFASVLTGYQGVVSGDAEKQITLRYQFDNQIAPGLFAEVVKIWVLRDASATRKFTATEAKLLRVYAKPWGRAAYADLVMKLNETGGPHDSTRDLRIRVTIGRGWRVIDAWDATTGRWLVGETPQYSGLALESEAPSAVVNYLWNESYVAGGPVQYPQRPGTSNFMQARIDALNLLNERFTSRRFVDRHFEGTTVKILRFDPATYLGDGILTVSVSGRLIEIDDAGKTRTTPFTQQTKFLRTVRGGVTTLNAVDQQSTNGTWDSGGELALYAVDIEFG
jgi:hypothetical protein